MNEFPSFMRNALNAIASQSQSLGVEGYVYDGVDGSQMAYWTCKSDGESKEHTHDYDEYFTVIAGRYDLIIKGQVVSMHPGQEYHIQKHVPHAGKFIAGTRTIHVFGGKRAERRGQNHATQA